jgi:glycosyltransferase involved in cell wall biosynthesis
MDSPTESTSSVAVLLCTYNGSRFLEQQLQSIAQQKAVRVKIYVSDDGSQDQTLDLLQAFRLRGCEHRFTIVEGPGLGYVANFFSLLCSAIDADYFAYSDQDDIWDTDKLLRAVTALSALPEDQPALYCSRTRLVDTCGDPLGLSPLFAKPPDFSNALIQNIGGGNSMVLNRKARDLLCAVGPVDVVSHDWWTYLLVSGCGGAVVYDPEPSLSYRQHESNLIGSNMALGDRLGRFSLALQGRKRAWNTKNVMALQQHRTFLTVENQKTLDEFCMAREASFVPRVLGLWRSGVHAQSVWANLALIAAGFLKKL